MVQLWPGDLESYFAYCDEQNRRDRASRLDYEKALNTLCEHGKPLAYYCGTCSDGHLLSLP